MSENGNGRRPFLTTREFAQLLNVSERTARSLVSARKVRSYKVGGSRRIDPADVDRYLASHCEEVKV